MRLVEAETVLETERLLLEPLLARHAAALYGLLQYPVIYRYVPQDPPETPEALEQRYRFLEARLSPRGDEAWLNWAIRLKARPQYVGRFEATVGQDDTAQIAYELSPAFWGAGYATEASWRVLSLLFEGYRVGEVTAEVDTRNEASIRLLERLEFERVEHKPQADYFKGSPSDEYTYRRLSSESEQRGG